MNQEETADNTNDDERLLDLVEQNALVLSYEKIYDTDQCIKDIKEQINTFIKEDRDRVVRLRVDLLTDSYSSSVVIYSFRILERWFKQERNIYFTWRRIISNSFKTAYEILFTKKRTHSYISNKEKRPLKHRKKNLYPPIDDRPLVEPPPERRNEAQIDL